MSLHFLCVWRKHVLWTKIFLHGYIHIYQWEERFLPRTKSGCIASSPGDTWLLHTILRCFSIFTRKEQVVQKQTSWMHSWVHWKTVFIDFWLNKEQKVLMLTRMGALLCIYMACCHLFSLWSVTGHSGVGFSYFCAQEWSGTRHLHWILRIPDQTYSWLWIWQNGKRVGVEKKIFFPIQLQPERQKAEILCVAWLDWHIYMTFCIFIPCSVMGTLSFNSRWLWEWYPWVKLKHPTREWASI